MPDTSAARIAITDATTDAETVVKRLRTAGRYLTPGIQADTLLVADFLTMAQEAAAEMERDLLIAAQEIAKLRKGADA